MHGREALISLVSACYRSLLALSHAMQRTADVGRGRPLVHRHRFRGRNALGSVAIPFPSMRYTEEQQPRT